MTEIPEDVMKLAGEVTSAMFDAAPDVWLPDSAEELIARAILAERERIEREGLPGWVKVPAGKAPMWADLDQAGHWGTTGIGDVYRE